jgi:hypothetical protein
VGFIRKLKGNSVYDRGATNFGAYQKETKDDTPDEQPPPDFERDCHAILGLWTVVEDLVRPLLGGQHCNGRKNIQDVDEEVLEYDNVEPHISREKRNR